MPMLSLPLRLLIAALGLAAACDATAGTLDQQVAADLHGVVEITNVSGEVNVSGWDRPAVSVHADFGADVQRVDVTSQSGRTVIRVVLPGMMWHWGGSSGSADIKVQVPRQSRLTVSTVSADVSSSGVEGPQHLQTVSGDITGDIGGADQEVKTVSGQVRLRGRGQQADIHVSTISGDMTLAHGAGDLDASSVSGDLDVSLDSARNVRLRTTAGTITFAGRLQSGGSLDAQSVSGSLDVRVPAEDGYEYEVSSFSGGIEDCFNVEPERTSAYGPGHRLSGSLGKGSGEVRLKTMSGSVQLCDR